MDETSVAIFSNEVMVEIVSWLPVKYIMQLRCLNKFFDTLIFDPYFVQMHLNKSTRYPQLSLMSFENENHDDDNPEDWTYSFITLSIPCLLQKKLNIVHRSNPYYLSNDYSNKKPHLSGILPWIVGSCNGLLCLFGVSHTSRHQWFCFRNLAMRKESEKFTLFFDCYNKTKYNFSFGYNNSTQTYKVVAFYVKVKPDSKPKSVVKVFSLGDNSWRDIQCLPVLPIYCLIDDDDDNKNDGVHLNGTINWIAFHNDIDIGSSVTVDQLLILSLDLSTETYTQLLLPGRFDEVLHYPPKLVVLMDCLCFCHDFEKTHFVIWQMKDFGVQESWIQLFNISYEHFYTWMISLDLLPLYLSDNGDTLVLTNVEHSEVLFIYNRKNNKVEQVGNDDHIKWSMAKDFVESLVSTH
jgi:F-box interacting protein